MASNVGCFADAKSYYPLNTEVYIGKYGTLLNKPEDITLRLTSILQPGHVIVGDRLFTLLSLSRFLLQKGLFYLGTVLLTGDFSQNCQGCSWFKRFIFQIFF